MEGERLWTIAEAKARLSEILRLVDEEGPQRIGVRKQFIVVPAEVWDKCDVSARRPRPDEPEMPLGRWIVENMRGLGPLELPSRTDNPNREVPFADDEDEQWSESS